MAQPTTYLKLTNFFKQSHGFTAMAFAFLLTTGGSTFANTCKWTTPILNLQAQVKTSTTYNQRFKIIDDLNKARKSASELAFAEFRNGTLKEFLDSTCLSQIENPESFLELIQLSFIEQSLFHLRGLQLPTLQKLMTLLDQKVRPGQTIIFKLTGGNFNVNLTEFKGGFHRTKGTLFMDIALSTPNDWFVVLAHELVHYLDEQIQSGSAEFFQKEKTKKMITLAKENESATTLTLADKDEMSQWLYSGLQHGLLAESRAWAISLKIYQEGLAQKSWPQIDWLEKMLQERKTESLAQYSLNFLAQRTYQSEIGIFSLPLTRNLLLDVINALLSGQRNWGFGNLAPVITDASTAD